MRLKIRRFDPSTLKPHRIILVIGRRGSGKSTLCEDILYHLSQKVDFGLFMTPTEESAATFRRHAPESWIYDSFNQSKLEEMLELQRGLSRLNKQRNLLCVLDDCMYDKKILKGTAIRDLHMNGRHLKVTFINCVQYLMDVGPELRSQVDYCVVLKEPIYANQVRLWKFFFGIFSNFQDFATVLQRCTSNYSALVLDNTQTSCELADCLFWYRANINVPQYKIGREIFWKLAARHTKAPEQREKEARERRVVQQLENKEKGKKDRVTAVTRQDQNGRTLKEDRGDVITLVAGGS